jgi:hypothetical protein
MSITGYLTILPIFAVLSSVGFWIMVLSCNKKLPTNERLSVYLFYPSVIAEVRKKYKELFPRGRWILLFDLSLAGLAFAFALAAWKLWPSGGVPQN